MSTIYGRRIQARQFELPPAIAEENFTARQGDKLSVILSWINPTEESFDGVLIVRKAGAPPDSRQDGTVVYSGTDETYTDNDTSLQAETAYYYRIYTHNDKMQFQEEPCITSVVLYNSIYLSELPASTASTKQCILLKEQGAEVPYIVLQHDYNDSGRTLILRDELLTYPEQLYYKNFNGLYNGSTTSLKRYDFDGIAAKLLNLLDEKVKNYIAPITILVNAVPNVDCGAVRNFSSEETVFVLNVDAFSSIPYLTVYANNIANYNGVPSQWTTSYLDQYSQDGSCYQSNRWISTAGVITKSNYVGSSWFNMGTRPALTLAANFPLASKPNPDGSYSML